MNGLDANRRAQSKIYQQHMASQIGLRVPLTYTGAQPKEAEAFAQQLWERGKRCCTKNIESTRIVINGKPHARYTQLFTPADVCQLDALSVCPMIFQEYAEKKWEYRVTVVGDKVFPCKIESQLAGGRTAIDWRHYDIPKTPHRACTISDTLTAKLVKLVRELGLSFGACDLIHTLTDDVLFLEINSLGSWLWIEDLAGLPITDSVAAQIAHMRQGN